MNRSEDSNEETNCPPLTARAWSGVFLILISLPLLLSLFSSGRETHLNWRGETLREKLSGLEDDFASLPLFEWMRDHDQARLALNYRVGNSRVVVGHDGWLYYRPDLDAVIGKGPFYDEPPSVARAPGLNPWMKPLPVILEFGGQLQERGIELVIVPVPTKAMMASLDGAPRLLPAEGYETLLDRLREAGIEVVDLRAVLNAPDAFLKYDTHWTPPAMEASAKWIAESLGGALDESIIVEATEEVMSGDLAGMLVQDDYFLSGTGLQSVILNQVREVSENGLMAPDASAPWMLLGDSFVNVFDDPSLGFPEWSDGDRIGAGLASHLSRQLGRPLHVIAMNGSGATGVRKAFASLPDNVVRSKEKGIWVLSARDLLLAEIPGRRAGIEWEQVQFNPLSEGSKTSGAELVVTATLLEKSGFGDPGTTPYASAIYATHFDSVTVEAGAYPHDEAHLFLWAFQEREIVATGRLEVGARYRLRLLPFPTEGPIAQAKQLDDFFLPDLPRFFVQSVEEVD